MNTLNDDQLWRACIFQNHDCWSWTPGRAREPIFEEGVLHDADRNCGSSIRILGISTERQLSIVYCRMNPYFRFMGRECSYCSQMIIHDVSHLRNSLLTNVWHTCT
ncbi:hypothetical protein TNCT_208961 [Trichonephila clavata]|uniref:Uncharacterized protein n=1 Tax=Trichonephila clavata TaxID=2740835 RepID=A0A8X6KZG1_TRICU|nr:hypothetical protein TNCT_208961 [Trichonephila clavata]